MCRQRCFLVVAAALAIPASAGACGFCVSLGSNSLTLPHPNAIEIAVATRGALDRGILRTKPLVPTALWQGPGKGQGMMALDRIPPTELVKVWGITILGPAANNQAFSVHFLFIDTEHSCGLTVRKGVVVYESKPATPCDARVVTTRAVFHALVAGELGVCEAIKLGLLRLEGDKQTIAFVAAYVAKERKADTMGRPRR